jgi:acetyl esterase/lipase
MMRQQARVGIGLLGLLALALPVRGDDETRAKEKATEDIVYRKAGDQELKLDLVEPTEGEGPFPALVVIHGGAWRGGNKRDGYVRAVMIAAAKRGYVAISPQYRFCPKETFPAQVIDVKAAVRWLHEHAEEHKVDDKHIGAVGFSAGGHLSLMLGLTGPGDGLEGDAPAGASSSKVQAVVNFFGPTDLAASDIPEVSKPLVRDFLGGNALEKFDAARKASPLTFVSPDDPPVLTFQGTRDPLVPYNQALRLAEALTEAGVPGRVELILGGGHGFGGADGAHTTAETFAFFDRYLKPKP